MTGPGWLDEPEHDEPVELGQLVAEWAATQDNPEIRTAGETNVQ